MGELTILDYGKIATITWDPNQEDEVTAARTAFNEMAEKGFSALKLNPEKGEGNQISQFDAAAGKILMFPFLVGG